MRPARGSARSTSVVFGGFSPTRCRPHRRLRVAVVITADGACAAARCIPLKANVDEALSAPGTETVEHVLVVKRTGDAGFDVEGRDRWWPRTRRRPSPTHPRGVNAEDPLFILYTSGPTGKPARACTPAAATSASLTPRVRST